MDLLQQLSPTNSHRPPTLLTASTLIPHSHNQPLLLTPQLPLHAPPPPISNTTNEPTIQSSRFVQTKHLKAPSDAPPAATKAVIVADLITSPTINFEPPKPIDVFPLPSPSSQSPLPKLPIRVSISRPSQSSKPPNQDVSTGPDLTNSDPLTPLPPFPQPRLMPPPRPPDRTSLPFSRQPPDACFQKTIAKSHVVGGQST